MEGGEKGGTGEGREGDGGRGKENSVRESDERIARRWGTERPPKVHMLLSPSERARLPDTTWEHLDGFRETNTHTLL